MGGKLDFVLHSIGMSPNVRKIIWQVNYDWFKNHLTYQPLVHKVMQVGEKLDAFNEWGSILALSYIAMNLSRLF